MSIIIIESRPKQYVIDARTLFPLISPNIQKVRKSESPNINLKELPQTKTTTENEDRLPEQRKKLKPIVLSKEDLETLLFGGAEGIAAKIQPK
jgi:hypothetical protein